MLLVLLGLAAALLLAGGFVLQQHEAAGVPEGAALRPGLLLVLVRRPVWLGGIATMVGGQLLGAVTLGMGSLVVVEPLLATNVLFALPMAALASRRRLSPGDWIGALLVVGGLALFLVGIPPRAGVRIGGPSPLAWGLVGAAYLIAVCGILLLARGRSPRIRAALTAGGAGALFGLQDFFTQRVVLRLDRGLLGLLESWQPYVLLVVAITGLTLAQRAFGLADLSAALPPITLAEPVAGIALSIGALGQALPDRAGLLACAVGGLVIMVTGVVLLTRSPLVVDPHARGTAANRPKRAREDQPPRHLGSPIRCRDQVSRVGGSSRAGARDGTAGVGAVGSAANGASGGLPRVSVVPARAFPRRRPWR